MSRDPGWSSDDPTRRLSTTEPGSMPPPAYETQQAHDDASMGERSKEAAEQAREKAGEAAHMAREKAGEATQAAREAVDAQRDTVAGGLDTVATQLRDRAGTLPGGEKTSQAAEQAAMRLEGASEYLRQHDVNDMMSDLERMVRSHPTESLIIAAAAGFLVGRMLKG